MKDEIFAAGSKFQIGGCPGKRTVFHLFVLKSNIALKHKHGQGVIIREATREKSSLRQQKPRSRTKKER